MKDQTFSRLCSRRINPLVRGSSLVPLPLGEHGVAITQHFLYSLRESSIIPPIGLGKDIRYLLARRSIGELVLCTELFAFLILMGFVSAGSTGTFQTNFLKLASGRSCCFLLGHRLCGCYMEPSDRKRYPCQQKVCRLLGPAAKTPRSVGA